MISAAQCKGMEKTLDRGKRWGLTMVVSWMDPKLLMKMLTLSSTGIPAGLEEKHAGIHSLIKVTLCNNLTLFEVWFYRQLVLVPSSNSFCACVFPTSHPGYALCSSVFPGWNTLQKWKKSFHTHDIGVFWQYSWQSPEASISVNWAVGGVCNVFACLLGS